MSEADKMFEKLGYKLVNVNSTYAFRYHKDFNNIIYFVKDYQEINKTGDGITVKELKAINKKVEELGWEE